MLREGHGQDYLSHQGKEGLAEERHGAVLLCGREEFCAEARQELQRKRNHLRVAATDGIESARQRMEQEIPAVILAEERVLVDGATSLRQRREGLAAALALLARYAPVIWIGNTEDAEEIAPVMRSAAVDFVPRSALCLAAAVTMVERRLRSDGAVATGPGPQGAAFSLRESALEGRDFGEVLRHELNNPLTGILGNAELLLLEVRRGRLDLPPHTLQRLEIITDLAVRMRETVRQLSDRWVAAGRDFSSEEPPPGDPPSWPVSG